MSEMSIDRRNFLRQSSTGVAAIGAGVLIAGKGQAARVSKAPNEQISIGIIGAGRHHHGRRRVADRPTTYL
jgi:hypothetical protein